MMLSIYKNHFERIKARYPNDHGCIIDRYIHDLVDYYDTFTSLATIEILDNLYTYKDDLLNQERLQDVYKKYNATNFNVEKLTKIDIKNISNRYIEELLKLGKE